MRALEALRSAAQRVAGEPCEAPCGDPACGKAGGYCKRGGAAMIRAALITGTVVGALAGAVGYVRGGHDAEDAATRHEVEKLRAELKQVTSERDVEYWSHQCDRQIEAERQKHMPATPAEGTEKR